MKQSGIFLSFGEWGQGPILLALQLKILNSLKISYNLESVKFYYLSFIPIVNIDAHTKAGWIPSICYRVYPYFEC